MAGISRSATVIAAYLIRKWGYSVRGVLDLMQGRREKVTDSPLRSVPTGASSASSSK